MEPIKEKEDTHSQKNGVLIPSPLTGLCDVTNTSFFKTGFSLQVCVCLGCETTTPNHWQSCSCVPDTTDWDCYGSDSFTRGENGLSSNSSVREMKNKSKMKKRKASLTQHVGKSLTEPCTISKLSRGPCLGLDLIRSDA